MMWGQWQRLSGRRLLLRSVVSLWFLLMALVWKEVSGVESMKRRCWCRSGHSSDCTILAIICVGTPRVTFVLPTPSNYHIAPTEVAADIRPTCFSEAYYLSKSVSSYCRRLRHPKFNIVYQSHQIRFDIMLLNSPSCDTNWLRNFNQILPTTFLLISSGCIYFCDRVYIDKTHTF
ncbi:hypothetical protein TNCV_2056371 [Trichonephila clavipes]|nr:hypothetical protein TNCV_2056371 [Trichonephila clavipes]